MEKKESNEYLERKEMEFSTLKKQVVLSKTDEGLTDEQCSNQIMKASFTVPGQKLDSSTGSLNKEESNRSAQKQLTDRQVPN